ncbi:MAG: hypothetical protein AAF228_11445 [Pseudomonadota bacterium]
MSNSKKKITDPRDKESGPELAFNPFIDYWRGMANIMATQGKAFQVNTTPDEKSHPKKNASFMSNSKPNSSAIAPTALNKVTKTPFWEHKIEDLQGSSALEKFAKARMQTIKLNNLNAEQLRFRGKLILFANTEAEEKFPSQDIRVFYKYKDHFVLQIRTYATAKNDQGISQCYPCETIDALYDAIETYNAKTVIEYSNSQHGENDSQNDILADLNDKLVLGTVIENYKSLAGDVLYELNKLFASEL